jgi:hypothetical protein
LDYRKKIEENEKSCITYGPWPFVCGPLGWMTGLLVKIGIQKQQPSSSSFEKIGSVPLKDYMLGDIPLKNLVLSMYD